MDIFEEIKEDLEREKYSNLWQRYGYLILLLIILIIGGTAAGTWWKNHTHSKQEASGNQFEKAIVTAGKNELAEAEKLYEQIAKEGHGDIAVLASLQKASLLAKQGKAADAITLYEQLSTTQSSDPALKELASLLALYLRIETGKADNLDAKFELLTKEGSVWRSSALELKGLYTLQKGDRAQAKEIFSALANAEETPSGIKERAKALAGL